jgi:VanZ family protein
MEFQLDLALGRPYAAALLLGCALLALVLFHPVARLFGWPPAWTLLAMLALGPVLTFTVPLEGLIPPAGAAGRVAAYAHAFLRPYAFRHELHAAGSTDERLANVLLFVPLALFGTLATRRGVRTAIAASALSAGIEAWQAASDVRVATVADWLHNTAGAVAGATAGILMLAAFGLVRRDGREESRPAPAIRRGQPARQ